jgi:hypothetical protein
VVAGPDIERRVVGARDRRDDREAEPYSVAIANPFLS